MRLVILGAVLALWASAAPAAAQVVLDGIERLAFDRPESWAMAWFGSLARPTPLGTGTLGRGELELGLEAGSIPHLDRGERTVGFRGTKEEDLNRSPALGRLRLRAGLPGGFEATLGWLPPVELDGVEPHLVALALRRRLAERGAWSLDGAFSGQWGRLAGDITCDRKTVAAGDDPVANPFRCLEPSADEMTVRTAGAELVAGYRSPGSVLAPYAGLLGTWFDNTFEVDARYGPVVDRGRLEADGFAWAAVVGIEALDPAGRLRGALELFYSPLEVARQPDQPAGSEDLVNIRAMLGYRIR